MNRRAAVTGLVVLAVVIAGCQVGAPGTDATEEPGGGTENPGSGTETTTPSPAPGPFDGVAVPPGVDESGVTDSDALLAAHADSLADVPVTVDARFHLTVDGNGQNVSVSGKTVPGVDRGWMAVQFQDGAGTYYTEAGTTYYREDVDGSVTYGTTDDVSAVPDRPRFGTDERIRSAVESAEWEPAGTVAVDGRTLLELRATSVDPPDVDATEDATVTPDGQLFVDPDGVVHHVEVRTTIRNDSTTVRYGQSVSLSDVGSTAVERPAWFDRAERD